MRGFDHLRDSRRIRSRTTGVRLRIPAPHARVRHARKPVMRRLAGQAAVLAGLPILILGLATGTAAAASAGGQVSNYPCTGIDEPFGITAGPAPTGERRCGSPTRAVSRTVPAARSGRSPPPGTVQQLPQQPHRRPDGDHGRAGRGAVVHQLQLGTGGSIGEITTSGTVTITTPAPASTARRGSRSARTGTGDGAVVHQHQRRLRGRSGRSISGTGTLDGLQLPRHQHQRHRRPDLYHGRPGRGAGAVVHQHRQHDRGDHRHRDGLQLLR